MANSENHDYNVPTAGTEDWHVPLNENFEQFDVDIEIRHTDDQKSNYTPATGAKFLAIDTGVVYRGDGANWIPSLVLGRIDGQPSNEDDSASLVYGHPSNSALGAVGAVVSGGGFDDGNTSDANKVYDNYGTIGGGRGNVAGNDAQEIPESTNATVAGGENNEARGKYASIGGGYDNEITAGNSTIAGGQSNTVNEIRSAVVGGYKNVINGKNATVGGGSNNYIWRDWAVIGGGTWNLAYGNYATISGGGRSDPNDSDTNNVVWDDYGTIGGGGGNQAGSDDSDDTTAPFATVAGGKDNKASNESATVGGGRHNEATGVFTTVGGGDWNTVSGGGSVISGGISNEVAEGAATVGGGSNNVVTGTGATVPGGVYNTAAGTTSFAAGRFAQAEDNFTFVWADGSDSAEDPFSSSDDPNGSGVRGPRTFHVKASNGARFVTSSATTYLDGNGGGWTNTSTRAAKTNVDPVDPRSVLAGVESMEVATWEYKDDDGDGSGTTHIGPMAEDFHAAFDVGDSDEHINSINADGVALAAIQGLSEKLDARDERIEELEDALEDREETITGLRARVDDHATELAALREELRELTAAEAAD